VPTVWTCRLAGASQARWGALKPPSILWVGRGLKTSDTVVDGRPLVRTPELRRPWDSYSIIVGSLGQRHAIRFIRKAKVKTGGLRSEFGQYKAEAVVKIVKRER